jgi:hypothetical protein
VDRPVTISLDASNLLSASLIDPVTMKLRSTPCPAFEFHGGQRLFAVNGVLLPDLSKRKPSDIRWDTFQHISSPQVRSALIGYVGWERFLELAHRKTLVDKSQYGELYAITCELQQITVVRVVNSTAEPDGTFRKYVIPVDADCRPLPNPADPAGEMGTPQVRTALNAVASTFGMTGEEYKRILGAQS